MKYYLSFNKNNEIVGCSNCLNIVEGIECREVTELEYNNYLKTLETPTKKELDSKKLFELEIWFNNYFNKQLTQSLWQDDFEVSHDDYFDKDYENIDELKKQAEVVRQEIKNLRTVVGGYDALQ